MSRFHDVEGKSLRCCHQSVSQIFAIRFSWSCSCTGVGRRPGGSHRAAQGNRSTDVVDIDGACAIVTVSLKVSGPITRAIIWDANPGTTTRHLTVSVAWSSRSLRPIIRHRPQAWRSGPCVGHFQSLIAFFLMRYYERTTAVFVGIDDQQWVLFRGSNQ